MTYNRESELRANLNNFLTNRLELPTADYYGRLDQEGFAELKSVLAGINNIFTLKVTATFASWLCDRLGYDTDAKEAVLQSVIETKPNTNGFDIEISGPTPVIAEVKCNVPINAGQVFGSAQRDGIIKDITSLVEGKRKSAIDTSGCLKFMVLLDTPEVRQATTQLIRNLRQYKERIEITGANVTTFSPQRIYIVYVSF